MAVMPYFADFLLSTLKKYDVSGAKLCTMSRQDVYMSRPLMRASAAKCGYKLVDLDGAEARRVESAYPLLTVNPDIRNDQVFWREIGFDSVTSIDASGFEGATHVFDLNQRDIPGELLARHDWLLDFGTMEHVFHVPNYLANVFDLVRQGGLVWHVVPCNNWVNHGFYQFSPTLLNDFYVQNGWEICERMLIQINDHWASRIRVYPYGDEPNFVSPHPIQQLDDQFYFSSIIARKVAGATADRTPQQYAYLREQWPGQKPQAVQIKRVIKLRTAVAARQLITRARRNPLLMFSAAAKGVIKRALLRLMSEEQFRHMTTAIRRHLLRRKG